MLNPMRMDPMFEWAFRGLYSCLPSCLPACTREPIVYGSFDNGFGKGLDFDRLPLNPFRFHRFFDSLLVLRQSGFARFNFDELDVDFAINVQAVEADEIDGAAQES